MKPLKNLVLAAVCTFLLFFCDEPVDEPFIAPGWQTLIREE